MNNEKPTMIPSVFDDEQELLKNLLSIHCPDGIELDPMCFKGNFYKEIEMPKLMFDINPVLDGCVWADAQNLPVESSSISCMILDPPFLFEIRNRINNNYSVNTHGIMKGFDGLETLYKGILSEANRVLVNKGTLIFKCQDFTDSKTTMTHCYVWKWAEELGFYAKDLAILHLPKNKIWNSKLTQRHMRKVHSYFWVFKTT